MEKEIESILNRVEEVKKEVINKVEEVKSKIMNSEIPIIKVKVNDIPPIKVASKIKNEVELKAKYIKTKISKYSTYELEDDFEKKYKVKPYIEPGDEYDLFLRGD